MQALVKHAFILQIGSHWRVSAGEHHGVIHMFKRPGQPGFQRRVGCREGNMESEHRSGGCSGVLASEWEVGSL